MKYLSALLFLIHTVCFSQTDQLFVHAHHPSIYAQGRILYTPEKAAEFAYSGVSFTIKTNSKRVYAVFEDLSGPSYSNYFNIIIDGELSHYIKVEDKKKNYLLTDSLDTSTLHTIEIFKRTEAFVGASRFHGFILDARSTVEPIKSPQKKLIIIGDSFSCGYGNMAHIPGPPEGNPNVGFNPENEDNYYAWGTVASRNLKMQHHCIAYSGRGLYRNNSGSQQETMPKIYDQVFPDDAQAKKWKHKSYSPDVIVIKLGTNDFICEAFKHIPVDSSQYVDTYIQFVKRLHKLHPSAQIICVAGGLMSDEWPEGKFALTRIKGMIQQVVNSINETTDLEICHYLELPTHSGFYGEDWHPTQQWHAKYAEILTDKIKDINP